MAHRVGQQLGNYRLVRLLGSGGYAQVYLGQHVLLEMQAAVKILSAQLSDREVERFCTEVRTISRLAHPNIVRLLEFDVAEGVPFLVMEYATNGTLAQRYPLGTRLALTTIVPFIKQAAAALQYAHDEKLIHRDVKPENLLLGEHDRLLLSDFGIAIMAHSSRSLMTQEVLGTVAYMAPEQLQGKPRPASDQYALGVIVYEWLSGDTPFHGSPLEVAAQHMLAAPPSLRERVPALPPAVEAVVLRALAKDPKARFANVQAFADALEHACQGGARTLAPFQQRSDSIPAAHPSQSASPTPLAHTMLPAEIRQGESMPLPDRFFWREGRRYVAHVPYVQPRDTEEDQRLDFQHYSIKRAMQGRNYLAPLTAPGAILDVGCGTGRWAIEMAAQFPQANVIGLDLIVPEGIETIAHGLQHQPDNVVFLEGNVLNGLPFADASFDLVYMRLLFGAIPAAAWPQVVSELVRVTRPGGWVESLETLPILDEEGSVFKTFCEWLSEALTRQGFEPLIALKMPALMRARGLVRVTTREILKRYITAHRSVLGVLRSQTIQTRKALILAQGVVTEEEYERMFTAVMQEIQEGNLRGVPPAYVICGQRPVSAR